MTTFSRILLAAVALVLCTQSPVMAKRRVASNDHQLSRITQNRDGTTTEFKRNPSNTTLEKITYGEKENGEKIIITRTIYRRNRLGKLTSGTVFDGKKKKLFRIKYGYYKGNGKLVAEDMFDARVRRTYPENPKKEQPVRATRWHYDAQGRKSAPTVFTSQAGAKSSQLMKWLEGNSAGSDVERDPYRRVPVNPNARPTGRR